MSTARRGGNDVTGLSLLVGDDRLIYEQFHQAALLLKGGSEETRFYLLAESLDRVGHYHRQAHPYRFDVGHTSRVVGQAVSRRHQGRYVSLLQTLVVVLHLCSLVGRAKGAIFLYKVGARELKQHTGEILERVRKGERIVLTHRGEAIALISPLDRDGLERALTEEAERAEKESLGWLALSEGAFSF